MFQDQRPKSQTQSGGALKAPVSRLAAEPAPDVQEANTPNEEEIIEKIHQTEQEKHPESDDDLKTPPAATEGFSKEESPALKIAEKDIKNEGEMDPQSERKRSSTTYENRFDEIAEESKKTEESSDEKPLGSKRADTEEVSEDVLEYHDQNVELKEMESQRKQMDSEDQKMKDEGKLSNVEVENVFNDNLPAPTEFKVINFSETEEVSDEELPEPKLATEIELMSVDELPNSDNLEDDGKDTKIKLLRIETLSTNKEYEIKKDVSEVKNPSDEKLPAALIPVFPETEEVSDGELPEPKRAELPADTEAVSEDELQSPKHSVADEEIRPLKKGSKRKNSTDEDYKIKKEGDGRKVKSKIIAKSDRYWKAVNKNPTDFAAWSYLLQFVDYDNDDRAARAAYEAFLSLYPYCFGYWRRYADYEKNHGNEKLCEEVLERGLKAIPLSVDLWIHYISYIKNSREKDEEYLRLQFERALTACSLDFRSDPLWELYIKWEFEEKRFPKVTAIFDRLLATPTLGYNAHFDSFQEYVTTNAPDQILNKNELKAMRKEVRSLVKIKENLVVMPPGDEDSKLYSNEKESKAMKEHIVSTRRKVYVNTVNNVKARWEFEQGIKRPYFHIKPLERCQLKNWEDYLDYEIEQGDTQRIIVLFERCLIACALYEGFWLKYIDFLESLKDADVEKRIRDVYERCCTVHHQKSPSLNLNWAHFEECCADFDRAAEILVKFEKQVPNLLRVAYDRINLERRRGNFDKCIELFEHYIATFEKKVVVSNISVKYSRFCQIMLEDFEKAQNILKEAIAKDPENPRLYLMLINLTMAKKDFREEEVVNVFDQFLAEESIDLYQKIFFARRKLQFMEDFSSSIRLIEAARKQYINLHKLIKQASTEKELNNKIEKKENPSNLHWQSSNSTWNIQPWYNNYGSQQGEYTDTQGNQYQNQNQNWQDNNYAGYHQWTSY